ncbi:MAG TPA: radical SAM family heme chaperone HemW [Bacteroidales bacterium]|nr:radical SAM family heme chaperone HemW [Bacteroidales bacterium]
MAGIYVHIPYCRKICSYCDFYRVIDAADKSPFIEAILAEASSRKNYLEGEGVSTIYFGGGTPSLLSQKELMQIISCLREFYEISAESEITMELNPDDVNAAYMKEIGEAGINRISLGIQSWNDHDLKFLNRRHDAARAEKALCETFDAGFDNVTIDLIYGLPGSSSEKWEKSLDKSLSFKIKHISAYHLTIEEGTILGKMKKQGQLTEIDEEESNNQFNLLIDKTSDAGFIHYEISNFGKEGYFSRHNTNYWKQVPYVGLGPSAHSFNRYSRQWNIKDVRRYISAVKKNKPFSEKEELGIKTRFNEYIMTSLRTMWGVDLGYVEEKFEKEGYDYVVNLAAKFISYGLMHQSGKSLTLTTQGKMISDNIISEFMMTER